MKRIALLSLVLVAACSKKPAPEGSVAASGKVSIVADGDGFHPSSLSVKKGAPLTLEFKRTSDQTCATAVVFPDLKIEKSSHAAARMRARVSSVRARRPSVTVSATTRCASRFRPLAIPGA